MEARRRRPSAAARRAGRRRPSWPSAGRTGRARAGRRRASRRATRRRARGRSARAPSRRGRSRSGSSARARAGAARRSCRPCPARPRRPAPSARAPRRAIGRRRVEKTAASKSLPRISVTSGTPSQAAKTGRGHDRPRAAEGDHVGDRARRRVGLQRAPGAVERVRRVVLDRAREVAPARLASRSPTAARARLRHEVQDVDGHAAPAQPAHDPVARLRHPAAARRVGLGQPQRAQRASGVAEAAAVVIVVVVAVESSYQR